MAIKRTRTKKFACRDDLNPRCAKGEAFAARPIVDDRCPAAVLGDRDDCRLPPAKGSSQSDLASELPTRNRGEDRQLGVVEIDCFDVMTRPKRSETGQDFKRIPGMRTHRPVPLALSDLAEQAGRSNVRILV